MREENLCGEKEREKKKKKKRNIKQNQGEGDECIVWCVSNYVDIKQIKIVKEENNNNNNNNNSKTKFVPM